MDQSMPENRKQAGLGEHITAQAEVLGSLSELEQYYKTMNVDNLSAEEMRDTVAAQVDVISGLIGVVRTLTGKYEDELTEKTVARMSDEEKAAEVKELRRALLERERGHDGDTYLKNKEAFYLDLEEVIVANPDVVLAVVDLDNLHGINEAYNHTQGDTAILKFADTMRDENVRLGVLSWREEDCYRIGGDEFVIIIRHVDNKSNKSTDETILSQRLILENAFSKSVRETCADLELEEDQEPPAHVGATVVLVPRLAGENATDFRNRAKASIDAQKLTKKAYLREAGTQYGRSDYL